MTATNNIATDLFYKIRSRFSGLKLGSDTGQITVNPEEARFFDFDYKDNEEILGHVSISLAEENSMKVYFSSGITLEMGALQKNNWYSFLTELRLFAKRRLMAFDTRDISKDNLDRRDYEFLVKTSKQTPVSNNTKQNPIGESIMNKASSLYGSKTTSYQKLMDTKLIIKHRTALHDDQQRGARSRNISSIFVENADGERFKYPFIHLAGARAMQRHVANHGVPYDDVGKSIIRMSEEISQLRNFSRYVAKHHLLNDDTNNIIEHSSIALKKLREQVARLHKQKNYEQYTESFYNHVMDEIPQEIIQEYTDKFTIKNFKEDIKSVFPILYRLMNETNTVEYSDIVANSTTGNYEYSLAEQTSDFDAFESWVSNLGENTGLTSENPSEKQIAIGDLQELINQPFPVGVNGDNATQSLATLITDSDLIQGFKDLATEDPDSDARPLLQQYLEFAMPDILQSLDFSDLENLETEEEIEDDSAQPEEDQENIDDTEQPAEETQEEGFMSNMFNKITGRTSPEQKIADFERKRNERRAHERKQDSQYKWNDVNVDTSDRQFSRQSAGSNPEIRDFVSSFYDRNTGTFPKGPEGVVTMAVKKFGKESELSVRKMVNSMAPVQKILGNKMRESKNNKGRKLLESDFNDYEYEATDINLGIPTLVTIRYDGEPDWDDNDRLVFEIFGYAVFDANTDEDITKSLSPSLHARTRNIIRRDYKAKDSAAIDAIQNQYDPVNSRDSYNTLDDNPRDTNTSQERWDDKLSLYNFESKCNRNNQLSENDNASVVDPELFNRKDEYKSCFNQFEHAINTEISRTWVEADPTGEKELDQTMVTIFYDGGLYREEDDYGNTYYVADPDEYKVIEVETFKDITDDHTVDEEEVMEHIEHHMKNGQETNYWDSMIDQHESNMESRVNNNNMVAESRYGKKMLSESQIVKRQDSKTLERIRKLAGL